MAKTIKEIIDAIHKDNLKYTMIFHNFSDAYNNKPKALEKLDSRIKNWNHEMPQNPIFYINSKKRKDGFDAIHQACKKYPDFNAKYQNILLAFGVVGLAAKAIDTYLVNKEY
jgi:hypothetical protein